MLVTYQCIYIYILDVYWMKIMRYFVCIYIYVCVCVPTE